VCKAAFGYDLNATGGSEEGAAIYKALACYHDKNMMSGSNVFFPDFNAERRNVPDGKPKYLASLLSLSFAAIQSPSFVITTKSDLILCY
jgi:hypothetical protein